MLPWKWWIFAVDFFFIKDRKTKENSAQKIIHQNIRHPKTKNPPEHNPAQNHQPDQTIRRKICQQIRSSNLQAHAVLLQLRRFAPGGVFRAWVLGHSWLPSGHGRGSPAQMHLRSLSCFWWQGQGLLRTLSDATFSQRC